MAGIGDLSSGEAQALTLAIDIVVVPAVWAINELKDNVLLVDEPDAHLHPDLQTRLADFLCQVVETYNIQLVVATHSTTLLAALGHYGRDKASVIYFDRRGSEFIARPFTDELRNLSACLGGHTLMGPLFGSPLLLVEGDDDYRIWSQVPRHDVVNLSAIPCGGQKLAAYRKSLETIFGSLCNEAGAPLGFALLDGDKPPPQASPQNPQTFVPFVQLNCHEAENLYLTDEVLAGLGIHWDEARYQICARRGEFGEKSKLLASAPEWDRRSVDLKPIIHQVSTVLDPKGVDWTIRVGKAIGQARPSGQLADFLGEQLIEALWGAAAQEFEGAIAVPAYKPS